MYAKLSKPLDLPANFEDSIQFAYEFFASNINNRAKRPALFDKEVFIEAAEIIDGWPVGFWHLISLEENHRFNILPCNNDATMEICNGNCDSKEHQIIIKQQTETRNICLFRASRLPWILDLIKFANRGDSSVQTWKKPSNDKLYLRYNHYGNDYIVIFSEQKHFYRIISAFPVFYTKDKKVFDRDAKEYYWSFF